MDYIDGLSCESTHKGVNHTHYFPVHSPLLRESWLVSIIALRRLICLSLARILTRADVPCVCELIAYCVTGTAYVTINCNGVQAVYAMRECEWNVMLAMRGMKHIPWCECVYWPWVYV